MQHYELGKLESIIVSDIPVFIEYRHSVDTELLARFKRKIENEVERVKISFVNSTINLPKEKMRELYVQYHEQSIIRLAGCLSGYVPPQKMHRRSRELDNSRLCLLLYNALQELLLFIKDHFSKYFDQNAWIPESYQLIVQTELDKDIPTLRTGLTRKGYSATLVNLILSVFEQFIQQRSSRYHRVIYLKDLKDELFKLIERTEGTVTDDTPLLWTLFDMNFNVVAYYNYATGIMNQFLDSAYDIHDRMDKQALLLKLMQQRAAPVDYAYEPGHMSIRERLLQWVQLEMEYTRTQPPLSSLPPETTTDVSQRIKVNLSVPQLAYFLRLLIECGILQQDIVITLIRKITQIFATKRTNTPSAGSLENQYYDVEHGTRQSVRAILTEMIRRIDKADG